MLSVFQEGHCSTVETIPPLPSIFGEVHRNETETVVSRYGDRSGITRCRHRATRDAGVRLINNFVVEYLVGGLSAEIEFLCALNKASDEGSFTS